MIYKKIDGVNYVRQQIPSADGVQTLEGITVRALRAALEGADPDAMIVYLAEQNGGLLFGCIAGAVFLRDSPNVLCALVGPEAVKPLKDLLVEL